MNTIHSIAAWFSQANPNPTAADVSSQLGQHYKEVAEGLKVMGDIGTAQPVNAMGNVYASTPASFITHIESLSDQRKEELLAALSKQIVTAVGVATLLGMDIEGALEEVNRSNWSEFEDGLPVVGELGSIPKGPGYTPPELTQFIGGKDDTGRLPNDTI